jgi:hypothetical protein
VSSGIAQQALDQSLTIHQALALQLTADHAAR